jgi:hypothetical protein
LTATASAPALGLAPAIHGGVVVAVDASAILMAAFAVQAGLEVGTELTANGGIEMQDGEEEEEDLIEDTGLEEMVPIDAIEDDMLDAVIQAFTGDGAGDTEEDEEPVTQ